MLLHYFSVSKRVENERRYEERIMMEWEEKAQVTEELLVSIEEIHQYAEAPETIDDFDEFVAKFEKVRCFFDNHPPFFPSTCYTVDLL